MTCDQSVMLRQDHDRTSGPFGILSRVVPRGFWQRGTARRAGFLGLSLVSPVSPVNPPCAHVGAYMAHDN